MQELFVEVFQELDRVLDDLVCQLDKVVAHFEHFLPRVLLWAVIYHLRLFLPLVCQALSNSLIGLLVFLRHEEVLGLNRLNSDMHLLQHKFSLVDELQVSLNVFSECFQSADSVEKVVESYDLESLRCEVSWDNFAHMRIVCSHFVILDSPVFCC